MNKSELYNYRGKVVEVVDGDTVKIMIDLGFHQYWETNCRLAGVNTDELRDENSQLRESAQKAKQYLQSELQIGSRVFFKSRALDRYRRPIVQLFREDGKDINKALLESGHAKPYKP